MNFFIHTTTVFLLLGFSVLSYSQEKILGQNLSEMPKQLSVRRDLIGAELGPDIPDKRPAIENYMQLRKSSSKSIREDLFRLREDLRAASGGVSTGGGDDFVIDFIQTALNEVYPWAKQNQDFINADKLIQAVDPQKILSTSKVYESCQFKRVNNQDGSLSVEAIVSTEREIERPACYNQNEDLIYLSRSLYPLDKRKSPSKMSLVAHELLRRLKLEGNEHLISGQWDFSLPFESSVIGDVAMASIIKGYGIVKNLNERAQDACQNKKQLNQDEVVSQVDQFQAEMDIASSLMSSAFKSDGDNSLPCSPELVASSYVMMLKYQGTELYKIKPFIRWWKHVGYVGNFPACDIASWTKREVKHAEIALKAATRYRNGDQTPICPEF